MYRITIDREACDGVFACLVRDDRFVEESAERSSADHSSGQRPREDSEGLAVLEVDGAEAVAATFDDDRRESAEQAAAACPLDAISVESVDRETAAATGEAEQ
ncbi:ferredoxin [Halomicroarcula sp. S1AR25-4]|uniref:ferredoxin n=1 Tax=Haloarcula sp. S1AR25-4 TaxID=2950538 RepID=UPI0028752C2A|nr:ferredoxin [Halomicroarcula sp. S1AR25-4]MDS0278744.1 ferredoxin [Halomicroarcula sp. S1AR25-4]